MLTQQQMKDILAAGGSVLYRGRSISKGSDLPSDQQIADDLEADAMNRSLPMTLKGVIDCSDNPNYPSGLSGDVYKISVSGKIGGAFGIAVKVGDSITCINSSEAGDQTAVGANWNVDLRDLRSIDNGIDLMKLDGEGGAIQLQVNGQDGQVSLGDYDGAAYYMTLNNYGAYLQTSNTVDIGDADVSGNGTALKVDDPNKQIVLTSQNGLKLIHGSRIAIKATAQATATDVGTIGAGISIGTKLYIVSADGLGTDEIEVGTDADSFADNIVALVNTDTADTLCTATASSGVITFLANTAGAAGNDINLGTNDPFLTIDSLFSAGADAIVASAKPSPSADTEGVLYFTPGSVGVASILEIGVRDVSNNFVWLQISP